MAQQLNNNQLPCPFCPHLPAFTNLRVHLNSTHSDKTEDELNVNGGTFKKCLGCRTICSSDRGIIIHLQHCRNKEYARAQMLAMEADRRRDQRAQPENNQNLLKQALGLDENE